MERDFKDDFKAVLVFVRIWNWLMWLTTGTTDATLVNTVMHFCHYWWKILTSWPTVNGYFIHSSVFCLTTGPKPPLKRFLHIVRSRASSFNWQYHLLSLRSSSSFLRLHPRLLVTSISPFIFPSITCFRRQFLPKMWQIQLAFRFLISYRIFLCSLTLK